MCAKKRHVLIVKIGAIGDVALALPLVSLFEEDTITWVVGKSAAPLLHMLHKKIDIIEIDDKKLLLAHPLFKCFEILKVWIRLLCKQFNLAITAHRDPRYKVLSWSCFKKKHRYFDPNRDEFPLGNIFHAQQYIQLALGQKLLTGKAIWPPLNIASTVALNKEQPIITIFPGGDCRDLGKKLRIWPAKHYAEVVHLLKKWDCRCVLIGAPEDIWVSAYFDLVDVDNRIGKTTLMEVLAILKESFCLVTHDGGAFHLARAVNCRRLGVFGPTSPKDFAQEGENEIVIWGGSCLQCSPCYQGKSFKTCSHQMCMQQVTAQQVVNRLITQWRLTLK